MDFNLSEEQVMLRDGVERFVRDAYGFDARRKLAQTAEGFSRNNWQQYADLGWLGLSLAEDVGGLECSFVETAIILEAFGHGMVLEPYIASSLLCGRIVDRSGSEDHRQSLLPALTEGSLLLALADSETGSRFKLGCVATKAKPNGPDYLLSGTKTLVLAGGLADKLLVTAALENDKQPSIFVVDSNAPGVSINRYKLLDGTQAADIVFDQVDLPGNAMLLDAEHALDVLSEANDRAILGVVAEILGVMEAVNALTSEYIKTRVQFGQPIGRFQALQHRMSEMFVEIQETRSALYRGMAYLDKDEATRSHAVSVAKLVAGSGGRFVCAQGVQLHGGIGMTEEYQVGHYFRRMTMLEKMFGDNDFHLSRIAARH